MLKTLLILYVVSALGCGRIGFEPVSDGDDPSTDSDTEVTFDTIFDTDPTDTEPVPYPYYRLQIANAMSNCGGYNSLCVTRVNLRTNDAWSDNSFSGCSGKIGSLEVDLRASSSYDQSPDPCEDGYYGPFLAVNNNNRCWGSGQDSVGAEAPFETSEWLEMHFEQPVLVSCVKILGGERGMDNDCAPLRYRFKGSYDGWNWRTIAGSEHTANTDKLITYCFLPLERPLAPHHFRSYFHGSRVNFQWEPGSGDEAGYLLVRGGSAKDFLPTDGLAYEPGPAGAYTVVYSGRDEAFSDSDVLSGTEYHYTLFAHNSDYNYSSPVKIVGTAKSKKSHRYYRLVVDSTYGYEELAYSSAVLVNLELQFDGEWAGDYTFSAPSGTIDGHQVVVSASSESGQDFAYKVFAAGQWTTETGLFDLDLASDATVSESVYLQLDFGDTPVAITGWRASSTIEELDYPRAPDAIRFRYSNNGTVWRNINGSFSDDVLWEETTWEW